MSSLTMSSQNSRKVGSIMISSFESDGGMFSFNAKSNASWFLSL